MTQGGNGAGSESVGDRTVPQLFEASTGQHADRPAQSYKGGVYHRSLAGVAFEGAPEGEFVDLTYGEMRSIVRRLATGFRELDISLGDRAGIFADTRMEWAQCDFALLSAGAVVTTVYESSSPDQIRHLLDDPDATAVVVENANLLDRVLSVEDDIPVETYIVMDAVDCDREDVYTLADVYEMGDEEYSEGKFRTYLAERDPEDLASLVYTSGTTGQPKGVRLTHRNFVANVEQVESQYGPSADLPSGTPRIDETTRTVSYLPLAHVFERQSGHFSIFEVGGCVAYAESVDTLKEDFKTVEPTAATSVPRVYEKIYDAVRAEAESSTIGERVFPWAVQVGRRYHREERPGFALQTKYAVADRLVFSNVRDALGGNIEMLVSGGGTLSKQLAELYHGMGLPIFEGYGLTEASPVVTTNPLAEPKTGTIGTPHPGIDIEIDTKTLPEEQIGATLGTTGELLIRGPNVTDGYWKLPEATEAAFTDDGYFKTGDIVTRRPDDYLVFRERSKQLLVLSTGKNVAPQRVEGELEESPIIDQAMIVGDGRKFVSAILVLDTGEIVDYAAKQGVSVPTEPAEMQTDESVRDLVASERDRANESLESHESVSAFRLTTEPFTEVNGLLTPTMKKKRPAITAAYRDEIESMYDDTEFTRTEQVTVDGE